MTSQRGGGEACLHRIAHRPSAKEVICLKAGNRRRLPREAMNGPKSLAFDPSPHGFVHKDACKVAEPYGAGSGGFELV